MLIVINFRPKQNRTTAKLFLQRAILLTVHEIKTLLSVALGTKYVYYYILPSLWVHVILSLSQTACQPTPWRQISTKPPPKNWPPVRRTCSTLSPAARRPQNKMADTEMAPRGRNSWEKICSMVALALCSRVFITDLKR
jgi:hypothetical protein